MGDKGEKADDEDDEDDDEDEKDDGEVFVQAKIKRIIKLHT